MTHFNTFRATIGKVHYVVTEEGLSGLATEDIEDFAREDLFTYDNSGELGYAVKIEAIAITQRQAKKWDEKAKEVTGWTAPAPKKTENSEINDLDLAAIAKAVTERRN